MFAVCVSNFNTADNRALRDLFYLADLSGNAAWFETFLGLERGEEGGWEEWEGGGRTKKKGTHVSFSPPFVPFSPFSP
jgi:hypothetical protein